MDFKLVSVAILILAAAACSPVKQVLKDPAKTERVVVEWRKKNPLDTTTKRIYLPGKDTIILQDRVVVDSVRLPYPVQHMVKETRYLDRVVVDTFKVYLKDTAMENVLMRRMAALETRITDLEDGRNKWRAVALFEGIFLLAIILVPLLRRFSGFK
jgi:hypothetical protein